MDELAAGVHPAGVARFEFGTLEVKLPAGPWHEAAARARDELDFRFFDWLTAYEIEAGLLVCTRLWSVSRRTGVVLSTCPAGSPPALPTLTDLWSGADWHERETHEMFGVVFDGHPNPEPLLLPDGFEGHPLRKGFALASRRRQWPGAADPDPRVARRPPRPPGHLDPPDRTS
jgi:NADH-quinone oxidoreductase subunit C